MTTELNTETVNRFLESEFCFVELTLNDMVDYLTAYYGPLPVESLARVFGLSMPAAKLVYDFYLEICT